MRALLFIGWVLIGCGGPPHDEPDAQTEDAGIPDADATSDADASCAEGRMICDGRDVVRCDGMGGTSLVETCDENEGQLCRGGTCIDACELAATERNYVGCEYWPTVTPNPALDTAFPFAVVIGNPNEVPTVVSVTRGGDEIARGTVAPGDVLSLTLPWIDALKGGSAGLFTTETDSVALPDGAYRLVSKLPVYVYQFSPLTFETTSENGLTYSYTNDASLLIPTKALGTEYIGLARSSFDDAPGFLSIVATADDTEVTFTSSARVQAGSGVPALMPGETHTFELDAGDVVQITSVLSNPGDHTDLTGSRVVSDRPIAMYGGHGCTFIPDEFAACDHLEEVLLPLDTWGRSVVAASTFPLSPDEPNYFRIVSGTDDNAITFAGLDHDPVTLDAGEFVELEHQGGFRVAGTGRVAVVQFMVSQTYVGRLNGLGDPAMAVGIPEEQLRSEYVFLVPGSYTRSWATLFGPMDAVLMLDGARLGAFTAIEGTDYGSMHVPISPGGHRITSEDRFGITLSGVAPFTSYLYPGGLDLKPIPLI